MSAQIPAPAELEVLVNPFPGLRPFELDESHLFFGRDGQSEQLIGKLSRTRFLAVVGTSGSGKSSLVRAGFLPALQGGFMSSAGSAWRVAILRPGNDPIGNLARALNAQDVFGSELEENVAIQTAIAESTLRRGSLGLVDAVRQAVMAKDENLLVIVDQFEEIFRFARVAEGEEYGNEAAAFIKLLLEASGQRELNIYVVLTMRSDYLGDCSQFWGLPEAINENQYLIPRLTRDQLREAISGPVAVGGGKITPRLVNRLLNEVGDNQDQLPVLQHLLMRSWDEWKERRLDVAVIEGEKPVKRSHKEVHQGDAIDVCCSDAVGGMAQALSNHADEAFSELPDDQHRETAEKLFKALTEKGTDNREIRRPITLAELCKVTGAGEDEIITIIETFRRTGRSFLMPPTTVPLNADSLIDISHESLIRGWTRLKAWVEEEGRSARIYIRLAETAMLHRAGAEALLVDPALQVALGWREKNKPNPAWARRYHPEFQTALAFLNESVAAQKAAMLERDRQQKRDTSFKRTKLLVMFLVVSSLLQLGMFAYTYGKNVEAKAALNDAVAQQRRADRDLKAAVDLGQEAQNESRNAKAAMGYALEAKQSAEDQLTRAETVLNEALVKRKSAEEQLVTARNAMSEALAQKSRAEEQSRMAQQSEAVAITRQEEARAAEEKAKGVLYAADMSLAHKEYEVANTERAQGLLAQYVPQEGTRDKRGFEWYYIWRLAYHDAAADKSATLPGHSDAVTSVAFFPDGKIVATGSADQTVKLWDVTSQRALATLTGTGGPILSVAVSPSGKMLATGNMDQTVKLWDVASGQPLASLLGHRGSVTSVAFSPDGRTLASGSSDKTVKLWDATSRRELSTLSGHSGRISSVVFSPSGKLLATASADMTVKLWNATSQMESATLRHDADIRALAFSPDGETLATGATDKTVRLWDLITKRELSTLKGHAAPVTFVAFSSDGTTLATGGQDNIVHIWDISSPRWPREVGALNDGDNLIVSGAFSPDGKTLATAGVTRMLKLWDIGSTDRTTLKGHEYAVSSVAFSPYGNMLASGSADMTVNLWDMTRRRAFARLTGHTNAVTSVAFSPNGKILATGSGDKTVKLWDVDSLSEPPASFTHEGPITSIAFSPRGDILAAGRSDKKVTLWDLKSQTQLATLMGHTEAVTSVAFSPLGNVLGVGVADGSVKLWDVDSKQLVNFSGKPLELAGHKSFITSLAFAPEMDVLATGSADRTVKIWDLVSGRELGTLKGHKAAVTSIAFPHILKRAGDEGEVLPTHVTTLASGGSDGTVKLWDIVSLRELATLKGHEGRVNSVAFSHDGNLLASASDDKTVKLWVAATKEETRGTRKLEWITIENALNLPTFTIRGGYEATGEPLYVCRGVYQGRHYVGKIVAGNCNVASNTEVLVAAPFDVLIGTNGKWLSAATKEAGLEMFEAAREDNKPRYICRTKYEYGLHVGMVVDDKCSFGFGGQKVLSKPKDYEVLMMPIR